MGQERNEGSGLVTHYEKVAANQAMQWNALTQDGRRPKKTAVEKLVRVETVSNREAEVQTEDEQTFLQRQQQILQQGQGQIRGESPLRSQGGGKNVSRTPGSTSQSSPKKMDVKLNPSTPGGEGVLANFFNSLLHKKSGSPATPPGSLSSPRTANGTDASITPDKFSVRTDAAAELDRLSRSVKKEMDFTQTDC